MRIVTEGKVTQSERVCRSMEYILDLLSLPLDGLLFLRGGDFSIFTNTMYPLLSFIFRQCSRPAQVVGFVQYKSTPIEGWNCEEALANGAGRSFIFNASWYRNIMYVIFLLGG